MLHAPPTIPLGAPVAYTPDPRITGRVVGHGAVHNSFDPTASGDGTYFVVIVRLDQAQSLGNVAHSNFHVPFDPAVLTVL